jgi:hypothetical protein
VHREIEIRMLVRLDRMLMRILLVVGGEIAWNRTWEIEGVAES